MKHVMLQHIRLRVAIEFITVATELHFIHFISLSLNQQIRLFHMHIHTLAAADRTSRPINADHGRLAGNHPPPTYPSHISPPIRRPPYRHAYHTPHSLTPSLIRSPSSTPPLFSPLFSYWDNSPSRDTLLCIAAYTQPIHHPRVPRWANEHAFNHKLCYLYRAHSPNPFRSSGPRCSSNYTLLAQW